jgi:hypothetical protein
MASMLNFQVLLLFVPQTSIRFILFSNIVLVVIYVADQYFFNFKGGKTAGEIADRRFTIQALALTYLEGKRQACEHELTTFQFPSPNYGDRAAVMQLDEAMRLSTMSRTLREELSYDASNKQRAAAEEHIQTSTTKQREVVFVVLSAVD